MSDIPEAPIGWPIQPDMNRLRGLTPDGLPWDAQRMEDGTRVAAAADCTTHARRVR